MSDEDTIELNAEISKRKLLGTIGLIGGATAFGGAGTLALLSDEEGFGSADNPNILQSGEVDLAVDWEVTHFGPEGTPQTLASQDEPVDRPGPIVDVADLKPGDIIEKTLSTHINGNPGFLTFEMSVLTNEDNGINNPEDAVDGSFDDSDGTTGGDLAENLNCVVWHDGFVDSEGTNGGAGANPGNNRPDEDIWVASGDPTNDADFEAGLDNAQSPGDAFDTSSNLIIASGTLADLANTSKPLLIDSRDQGDTPEDYSESACYDSGAIQYIGCACWLPRDVPGVDDNILQTDRLEYQFRFGAIQCRDNIADDGTPLSTEIANQPADGGTDTPTADFEVLNELTEGEPTAFDASSSSHSDGSIVEYRWEADGTEVFASASPTMSYSFADGGDHTVTLTVTDEDGAVDSRSKTVTSFEDSDGDGYGDSSPPDEDAPAGSDCDDEDHEKYPGAPEVADGKDNDCDGIVDEGFD